MKTTKRWETRITGKETHSVDMMINDIEQTKEITRKREVIAELETRTRNNTVAPRGRSTQTEVTTIRIMHMKETILIEIVLEIQDGVILKIAATTVSCPADFGMSEGGAVIVTLKIIIRETIINGTKLNIVGIAESHLKCDNVINIENYMWFGHNREKMHKNAKRGSGGVGFFVRKELNNYYDIEIIDKTTEGILWICVKTKDIQNAVCFYACVCYLPPQESSRMVDPANFLDTLLGQIHMYGRNAPFYYFFYYYYLFFFSSSFSFFLLFFIFFLSVASHLGGGGGLRIFLSVHKPLPWILVLFLMVGWQ